MKTVLVYGTLSTMIAGKILLVEDEAIIALAQTQLLRKHDFEVVHAHSGEEAVSLADREAGLSVILMDIDLGDGIDGTEAAQRILAHHDIPIIFVTSHAEKSFVDRVKKITSYGYVLKNSGEFVLIEAISMATTLFRAHTDLLYHQHELELTIGELRKANEHLLEYEEDLQKRERNLARSNRALRTIGACNQVLVKAQDERRLIEDICQAIVTEARFSMAWVGYVEGTTNRTVPPIAYAGSEDGYLQNLHIAVDEGPTASGPAALAIKMGASVIRNRLAEEAAGLPWRDEAVQHGFRAMASLPLKDGSRVFGVMNIYSPEEFSFGDEEENLLRELADDLSYGILNLRARAEADVRRKENETILERLRITLNSIGDAVIATDVRGLVETMNPMAARLTGWSDESARGVPLERVFNIINARSRLPVINPVGKVLETGQIVGLANHTVLIARDGQESQIADSAAPIRDAAGVIRGVVLVFRDVTAQYEQDRLLKESEEKYRELIEKSPVGIFQTDSSGAALHVNPKMAEIVGAESPEAAIAEFRDLARDLYADPRRRTEFLELLRRDGKVEDFEYEAVTRTGQRRWIIMNAIISKVRPDGSFVIDGFADDVTARKTAQHTVVEQQVQARMLFDQAPIGMLLVDTHHAILEANPAAAHLLGFSPDELVGMHASDLIDDSMDGAPTPDQTLEMMDAGKAVSLERRYRTRDGGRIDAMVSMGKIKGFLDKHVSHVVMFEDITNRKRVESDLRKTLQEKEFLMKEIYHRTKNNLMMVSSLISLKAMALGDEVDLSDLKSQIDAIEGIYERLSQSEYIAYVDFGDYMADILASVFATRRVEVKSDICMTQMPMRMALLLGLIVNELATNAMKHGFSDEQDAVFSVQMRSLTEESRYELVLANSGRPFPESTSLDNPGTLGLRLVTSLVDQLKGTVELERQPSARFTISFPASEAR